MTFDDFGNNQIMANTVSAGRDYSFGSQTESPTGSSPSGPTSRTALHSRIPVSISNTTDLNSLEVTVNIVDSSDQNLGLDPDRPQRRHVHAGPEPGPQSDRRHGQHRHRDQRRQRGGRDLHQQQHRAVTRWGRRSTTPRPAASSTPHTGGTNAQYRAVHRPVQAERRPREPGVRLSRSMRSSRRSSAKGINGTWKLETNDTNTPTTPPTSPELHHQLVAELRPGADAGHPNVIVPGTKGLVVPGSVTGTFSTASPASPVGIGPGVVMAQDNTLGAVQPVRGADLRRVRRLCTTSPSPASRTPPTIPTSS